MLFESKIYIAMLMRFQAIVLSQIYQRYATTINKTNGVSLT